MRKNCYLLLLLPFLFYNCSTPENKPAEDTNKKDEMETPKAVLEYRAESPLGEGAFWNYKTQEFYWVDILDKQVHIYNPASKENKSFSTPSMVGTVVPAAGNEAIIALVDGIYMIDTENGSIKPFSDVEADKPGNRFNDGKCDPAGRFWVGSMHFDQSAPEASLYMINQDGFYNKMLDSITISNGIVWTKDHKTMYYIDTPTKNIRAFDYDVSTGAISNERVAVTVPDSLGSPDGMAIDEEDKLWVGMWNGNAVVRFDPIAGKMISKIEVPAHNVTACAFGGENLDRLYITTARVDMTEEELTKYPDAGSIFVADPGVKGVQSAFFGE